MRSTWAADRGADEAVGANPAVGDQAVGVGALALVFGFTSLSLFAFGAQLFPVRRGSAPSLVSRASAAFEYGGGIILCRLGFGSEIAEAFDRLQMSQISLPRCRTVSAVSSIVTTDAGAKLAMSALHASMRAFGIFPISERAADFHRQAQQALLDLAAGRVHLLGLLAPLRG